MQRVHQEVAILFGSLEPQLSAGSSSWLIPQPDTQEHNSLAQKELYLHGTSLGPQAQVTENRDRQ